MVQSTGGEHLIAFLEANNVKRIFGVPGESYLAALDALVDSEIDFIQCRHEAGAANMAEAHGKLTGQPGICFVTRGPGATQAAVGVHTAFQDSTPMILLVGQVRREDEGREAFQELDYSHAFAGLAKAAFEIRDPARMQEQMLRAFSIAMNGRPGPVVVAFPEDVLRQKADAPQPPKFVPAVNSLNPEFVSSVVDRLRTAKRPFLLVGGQGWDEESAKALESIAKRLDVPVLTSFRAKHLFDNAHSHYAGEAGIGANPKLVEAMRESDLIVALGPRLGEMTTQSYDLFDVPNGAADKLIHVHPGAEELNRVYYADVSAVATGREAALALRDAIETDHPNEVRTAWRQDRRADYKAFVQPVEVKGLLNPSEIWTEVSELVGEDAIVTNGAGNFAAWLHRFYQHKVFPSQLGPTSGAMGYGLPAAIAAKLELPERTVIAVCGDGDFMMASTELATIVQHNVPIVICIFNNSVYGTIRMHQARDYPGRRSGTELVNPDFAALAESYGIAANTVSTAKDFISAFKAGLESEGPLLIHVQQDPDDIAPGRTLTQLEARK